MALYENIAKVRKLVAVRRVKRWIAPGERVDLDSTDVRHLGGNAAFMRLVDDNTNIKPKKIDSKSKKSPVKKETKPVQPDKKQLAVDRKELKESLEGMTKKRIMEIGEELLDIDLKWADKKDKLIKDVLAAAKSQNKYRYVLENS